MTDAADRAATGNAVARGLAEWDRLIRAGRSREVAELHRNAKHPGRWRQCRVCRQALRDALR